MSNLKITLLKRYDVNGSFTHDYDLKLGEFTPEKTSMWRVDQIIDVLELLDDHLALEEELEDLTEANRLLTLQIEELCNRR